MKRGIQSQLSSTIWTSSATRANHGSGVHGNKTILLVLLVFIFVLAEQRHRYETERVAELRAHLSSIVDLSVDRAIIERRSEFPFVDYVYFIISFVLGSISHLRCARARYFDLIR